MYHRASEEATAHVGLHAPVAPLQVEAANPVVVHHVVHDGALSHQASEASTCIKTASNFYIHLPVWFVLSLLRLLLRSDRTGYVQHGVLNSKGISRG